MSLQTQKQTLPLMGRAARPKAELGEVMVFPLAIALLLEAQTPHPDAAFGAVDLPTRGTFEKARNMRAHLMLWQAWATGIARQFEHSAIHP
ncbi:MAG TPA: hypothetical protein VFY74_06985 [Methyloceanibacter sp.]|nr:hypothetical protein [Methyloceanibacter sp.]